MCQAHALVSPDLIVFNSIIHIILMVSGWLLGIEDACVTAPAS